jgi:hypothetical protein
MFFILLLSRFQKLSPPKNNFTLINPQQYPCAEVHDKAHVRACRGTHTHKHTHQTSTVVNAVKHSPSASADSLGVQSPHM